MSFKETRELEGIEAHIHGLEAESARIENLFATPDFHRTHGAQMTELTVQLEAARAEVAQLYKRWEELEALKAESLKS